MAARAKTGEGLPAGLSAEREVGNKTPLTLADFEGYFAKLPGGGSRTSRGL